MDHYQTLGVLSSASHSEIKAAYRILVKEVHPDLHPNDPRKVARFRIITEAYETLSDPALRSRYDAVVAAAQRRERTEASEKAQPKPPPSDRAAQKAAAIKARDIERKKIKDKYIYANMPAVMLSVPLIYGVYSGISNGSVWSLLSQTLASGLLWLVVIGFVGAIIEGVYPSRSA